MIRRQFPCYIRLMRLNKPIGIFLLLWPTLWALWIAGGGLPDLKILFIFIGGVFLMRAAGCVINDFADRQIDGHVARTSERPFAKGQVTTVEALFLAGLLGTAAFSLVLMCNRLTIQLAFIGAGLTVIYPFMKRFTYFPQVGLGLAFAWGIPMAFAAQTGTIGAGGWFLYATGLIWPIIYDTMYAMVDRTDDLKIGVKSTAILFNQKDRLVIGLLQILMIVMLIITGILFDLHLLYFLSLIAVASLFIYQQWLIKDRDPQRCFRAFLNNHWIGMIVFVGIVIQCVL